MPVRICLTQCPLWICKVIPQLDFRQVSVKIKAMHMYGQYGKLKRGVREEFITFPRV